MTHTPGPWKENNGVIMGDFFWIAQMELTGGEDEKGDKEQKANARLIAAAPDMLAMLKVVTERLEMEVQGVYCNGDGEVNQGMTGCYERDMQPVRAAQALIAAIEGAEVTA